jgi:hypothetical protein
MNRTKKRAAKRSQQKVVKFMHKLLTNYATFCAWHKKNGSDAPLYIDYLQMRERFGLRPQRRLRDYNVAPDLIEF